MCETKNNEWKRCMLSIQWSIDNNIETTRIKPNFASLNSSKLIQSSLYSRQSIRLSAIYVVLVFL